MQYNKKWLFNPKGVLTDLQMQNTTNSLDGGLFSPMKMLLKIHRGIGIEMKKKLITDYLENRIK